MILKVICSRHGRALVGAVSQLGIRYISVSCQLPVHGMSVTLACRHGRALVRGRGYTVTACANSGQALETLRDEVEAAVQLGLTPEQVREKSPETAKRAREKSPGTHRKSPVKEPCKIWIPLDAHRHQLRLYQEWKKAGSPDPEEVLYFWS